MTALPSGPTIDPSRRAGLLRAKLAALVSSRWDIAAPVQGSFPGGSALRMSGRGWVLAEDHPERALGPALAWAARAGVDELHLVAASGAGGLARQALQFAQPPRVWAIAGAALVSAQPELAAPLGTALPPEASPLARVIGDADAEAVVEGGELTAEVLGLEVARAVVGEDGGWHLEVGVGRHDRAANQMLRADEPPHLGLARAVAEVRRHRRPDAPSHPANQLTLERWLRAVVLARPDLVGCAHLVGVDPPRRRSDWAERAVAPAVGQDAGGAAVVVVCSVGVDPDLVPAAADVRWRQELLTAGAKLGLVLAVPEGDDHPLTRALAGALARPAQVRVVPRSWRRVRDLTRFSLPNHAHSLADARLPPYGH